MTRADSPATPARYLMFPLLAALIWSVNMIVTKMAAGLISPAVIGFYRWTLAGVLLTPFALPGLWRQRRLVWPYLPKFAVLGGLGMALYQGLAYVAAGSTTATNMGIITAMIPLLTIAVGALVLRERPSALALLGGLLSLAGLALLIGEGDPTRLLSVGANHGDVLMGVAALAYALYGVLLRRWGLPVGPWVSLYVQVAFGVLFQLPGFLDGARLAHQWRQPAAGALCGGVPVAVRAVPVDAGRAAPGAEPRQRVSEPDAGGHGGDRGGVPGREAASLSHHRRRDGAGRGDAGADAGAVRRLAAGAGRVVERPPVARLSGFRPTINDSSAFLPYTSPWPNTSTP